MLVSIHFKLWLTNYHRRETEFLSLGSALSELGALRYSLGPWWPPFSLGTTYQAQCPPARVEQFGKVSLSWSSCSAVGLFGCAARLQLRAAAVTLSPNTLQGRQSSNYALRWENRPFIQMLLWGIKITKFSVKQQYHVLCDISSFSSHCKKGSFIK